MVGAYPCGRPPTNVSCYLHVRPRLCEHSFLSIVYYSAFLRKRRNQKTSIGDTPKELCPDDVQPSSRRSATLCRSVTFTKCGQAKEIPVHLSHHAIGHRGCILRADLTPWWYVPPTHVGETCGLPPTNASHYLYGYKLYKHSLHRTLSLSCSWGRIAYPSYITSIFLWKFIKKFLKLSFYEWRIFFIQGFEYKVQYDF